MVFEFGTKENEQSCFSGPRLGPNVSLEQLLAQS